MGGEVATLLADPGMWDDPPSDLGDRILAESTRDDDETTDASLRAVPTLAEPGDTFERSTAPKRRSPLSPIVLGTAAAIAVVFGGIVALSAISGNARQPDVVASLVPTGLIADVEGDIEVTSLSSGLEIQVDAPSLPRRAKGEFYEGWLRLDDDRLVPVGTFHEGDGVTLWAGIELDRVVEMTITLETAVAADSAEQASSRQVVLKFDFPAR